MNIYLISLIDKILAAAVHNFSPLPWVISASYLTRQHLLAEQTKRLIDFYTYFFQCIGFIPHHFNPYKRAVMRKFDRAVSQLEKQDFLSKRIFSMLEREWKTHQVLPVHIRDSGATGFSIILGILFPDNTDSKFHLVAHELGIPKDHIQIIPEDLQYLQELIGRYNSEEYESLRNFAALHGRNYNKFQQDCKIYFGDTFYRFYVKLKMIDVVDDLLFTRLSLKEIAYKNHFSNYNNLYKVFTKIFSIPLMDIPRFLYEF